jgi:hypothetical protein
MVIFGYRGRTSNVARGSFHCPFCGAVRGYTHQKFTRWFTLYFLPIFPLNDLGESLKCDGCGKQWDTMFITKQTAATSSVKDVERLLRRARVRAVAGVLLAKNAQNDSGGALRPQDDPKAIDAALKAFGRSTGKSLSPGELTQALDDLAAGGGSATAYLEQISSSLTPVLNRSVLAAACEMAVQMPPIDAARIASLHQMAAALKLTPDDVSKLIARAVPG